MVNRSTHTHENVLFHVKCIIYIFSQYPFAKFITKSKKKEKIFIFAVQRAKKGGGVLRKEVMMIKITTQ